MLSSFEEMESWQKFMILVSMSLCNIKRIERYKINKFNGFIFIYHTCLIYYYILTLSIVFYRNIYHAEYKCHGPGSCTNERAGWSKKLSFEEATPFLSTKFVDGRQWLFVGHST